MSLPSPECTWSIGMEAGDIHDGQIIASTNTASAPNARLSNLQGWSSALGDTSPWLKIRLLALTEITGVVTQGDPNDNGWVKSFKLSYEDIQNSYLDTVYVDRLGDEQVKLNYYVFI